jgi:Ca-activated chloride channel homolog
VRFADPYLFALLLVIPALLLLRRYLRDEGGVGVFSHLDLLASYRPTWRIRFRWVPTAFRALALVLLVLALARPQAGEARSDMPGQGIDIVLVLDTSSSMTVGFGGNETRAEAAERVLVDFIDGRTNDRIGIVIFRDESLVLSPLSVDYESLKRLVADAQAVNLSDGTAIGLGLAEAVNLLRDSRARSRVAILLTDGENNNRTIEPMVAARIAETLGLRLYTIGVIDGRGAGGVDERALREMAELTGGRYFSATSPDALSAVYEQIDQLETSLIGRLQFVTYRELAVYFLIAALGLLVFEQVLRVTVWRRAT